MLKNKFKIIALLTVIILSLMIPIVRAENETADNQFNESAENLDIMPINESEDVSDDNFKKGDLYLVGDNITIDYIVDGNVFIFANTVTINSQIGGDVFVCAGTVNVGEEGSIFSNLFAFAKDINISGLVYDLYASSQNVTISGYIYRDIRVGLNTLNIDGVIGRNAFVTANSIHFATSSDDENSVNSQGVVNGDFNYTSNAEISIPEGSVVGNTNFTQAKKTNASIQFYILSLGKFLTTVAVIWLFCLWITPKFLKNTKNLITKKLLPVVGYGILTPILALIVFVLLFVLGITSTVAGLGIAILFLGLAISSSIFVITINYLICDRLKIEKTMGIFGLLLVTAAIVWLVTLIPYVGSLISYVAAILGLGILVKSILPEKTSSKKVEEK